MRKLSQLALALAAILSLPILAMAPVGAEHGAGSGSSGSSSDDTSNTTSTSSGGSHETENETETETENEVETHSQTSGEVQKLEDSAKTMLETERKDGSKHSQADRQTACKAHQAEINKKVNNYAGSAKNHLATFTDILSKVENFVTAKQLTVTNYDSLLATAQSKEVEAQTAVNALAALNATIDCSQSDPAQSVATVKTAVANARAALQAYRGAIKDLITAVKGVSSANEHESAGGDQ